MPKVKGAKASATAKPKPKASKPAAAKPATAVQPDRPRQLKVTPYKSFRLQKKIRPDDQKVTGSFRLFGQAVRILFRHWPIFLGIIIVYFVISVVLVGSLSLVGNSNLGSIKDALSGNFNQLFTGFTLFAYLASSSGLSSSPTGGSVQTLLIIFISLALIWALRQAYIAEDGRVLRIRDAFYNGMAPLTQFILVLIVLMLELIPLAIGALIYSIAASNGIAIGFGEKAIFGVIFFLLAVVSFYMLSSSVFAMYIVTLKGMTPIRALRSAGQLVRYRRVRIFLKLLFVFIALIVISAIIIIPLAIWVTPAAPYVFYALTLIFLAIFHSYIYALYRELI